MSVPNKFYNDIEEIITHWKIFNPTQCHLLGIHDYDGILPNYSTDSISERIIEIKEDIVHLIALKRDYTDPYTIFEFNLVKLALEQELYELSVYKEYTFDPVFYVKPLSVLDQSLTIKSFAPITKRIEILTEYLKNLPDYLNYPKEHLIQILPDCHFRKGLNTFEGLLLFLKNGLNDFLAQSTDPEITRICQEAIKGAIQSLEIFIEYLKCEFGPNTSKYYSLGKEKFITMLKKREFVNLSAEELLKIGQEDLDKNYSALKSILDKHDVTYIQSIFDDKIPEKNLLIYAQQTIDRLHNFIIEQNLVDLPQGEACAIIETPESVRRYGFAGFNASGIFETDENIKSFFHFSFPDPNWDSKQLSDYYKLFNKAFFENIAISEVFPGEFTKFLFEKYKTKSYISKLFSKASSMIEGYTNYVLEMMIEQNYNPWPEDCDKIKVGQLILTLIRNVRFIVSIGIHCFNMSIEDARKLFKEKAFVSEERAVMEVERAFTVPMYLNFTLGKLLIKKLREDYINEQKENYSLKMFHNELLSYGSAPITLLRQVMLKDKSIIPKVL